MRRIVCDDCKKTYDYDRDEFCPRCGAFNQPVKVWSTDAQGNVVRVDGVNEQNHAGSFAHREVHKEKQIRKAAGLDRPKPEPRQPFRPRFRKTYQDTSRPYLALIQVLFWLAVLVMLAAMSVPVLFMALR